MYSSEGSAVSSTLQEIGAVTLLSNFVSSRSFCLYQWEMEPRIFRPEYSQRQVRGVQVCVVVGRTDRLPVHDDSPRRDVHANIQLYYPTAEDTLPLLHCITFPRTFLALS